MARTRTVFVCQGCGHQAPRWMGRCPGCAAWNTLVEEVIAPAAGGRAETARRGTARAVPLASGIGELDRVLGGGFVAGSVVLLGGEPGIGKSTLALHALERLSASGHATLYVTGEESARQTRMRAERLGLAADKLLALAESALEPVLAQLREIGAGAAVIDSIQTLQSSDLGSAPGSVSQVREAAARILDVAKTTGLAVLLVGHVTKDGAIAGPKLLEHLVDVVLSFEGEPGRATRILRGVKNRFGATDEIGVFEMRERGLVEVSNPSAIFLADLFERDAPAAGSVVAASLEGTRPLLVEVQALVSSSRSTLPRRTTLGVDDGRVAMLLAVLEKKAGLDLAGHDVYVNVAGGVRITEPAVDLPVVAALASSFLDRPVPGRTALAGEVGLTGEVRGIAGMEGRAREAGRLGFERMVLPRGGEADGTLPQGLAVLRVASVGDLLEALFHG
jgi:DNA repair protein RadA/Sms